MIAKTFEVRDSMTHIPVVAVQLHGDGNEGYPVRRAGFWATTPPNEMVLLTRLTDSPSVSCSCPRDWGGRTMPVAHKYIAQNFAMLESGSVVDVEYIRGETSEPKRSEKFNDTSFL
jgi:hypothetical protein